MIFRILYMFVVFIRSFVDVFVISSINMGKKFVWINVIVEIIFGSE